MTERVPWRRPERLECWCVECKPEHAALQRGNQLAIRGAGDATDWLIELDRIREAIERRPENSLPTNIHPIDRLTEGIPYRAFAHACEMVAEAGHFHLLFTVPFMSQGATCRSRMPVQLDGRNGSAQCDKNATSIAI